MPALASGIAVMDQVAMPIIGEGDKEPNDTFVKQLVGNAEAALKVLDETGRIDTKESCHRWAFLRSVHDCQPSCPFQSICDGNC